jgi:regulation of enolase protein 1 (concanavalin A-like superfamily)
MKPLLFYITALLFTSCILAEVPDTVKISSIPFNLYWENHAIDFSSSENGVTITAGAQTDMYRAPDYSYNMNNAPQLLFNADENFVLTASIEHGFNNKWDAGAIVIKSDSLNYIKYCFEKDYIGTNRVVSVVTRGVSDDCNSVEVKSTRIFFKAAKSGNLVLLYYSEDGTKWYLVRASLMDFKGTVKAGFLAQSPAGEKNKVTFSNIKYEVKIITDPFDPEK